MPTNFTFKVNICKMFKFMKLKLGNNSILMISDFLPKTVQTFCQIYIGWIRPHFQTQSFPISAIIIIISSLTSLFSFSLLLLFDFLFVNFWNKPRLQVVTKNPIYVPSCLPTHLQKDNFCYFNLAIKMTILYWA